MRRSARRESRRAGPADVVLADRVEVGWRAVATGPDGASHAVETWVEFPDDVRSLLELATWSRGLTIRDLLERVAAAHLDRLASRSPASEHAGADGAGPRRYRISTAEVRDMLCRVAGVPHP
jgi:hypothetical protein